MDCRQCGQKEKEEEPDSQAVRDSERQNNVQRERIQHHLHTCLMRYLFDTQALVFYLEGDSKLPSEIRDFIEDYENQGYVSVITLHELVLKTAKNQLELSNSLAQIVLYLKEAGVEILPLNHHHIIRLDSFERESYHKDPFDRLLVAQCIEENITMLTSDTKIPLYKKYGLEYLQYELD